MADTKKSHSQNKITDADHLKAAQQCLAPIMKTAGESTARPKRFGK